MLCNCSREQFHFEEEPPQSPESLATRDFSISSRTRDWGSKFDEADVDDVESALKETISLNYEEARALLGRLEYQRGNFDAALQVFEGIDISGLRPKMVKAIAVRTQTRRARSKVGVNLMSLHSVSLLLEAILLKSKSLEGLGQVKDAAIECKTIIDIIESAWPRGMPGNTGDDCKLKEMLDKALELLPRLWIRAGSIEEAIAAYRRALTKPWNLNSVQCANIQKDLAVILLYGGVEATLLPEIQQSCGSEAPRSNIEEAILLLSILMGKVTSHEINWDPEIMNHLTYALSCCGQFEVLACHLEQLLPGVYTRAERWYTLALCYAAAELDDVALNILQKSSGHLEKKHRPCIPSLLLGAKLCSKNQLRAYEGAKFAIKALESADYPENHFIGLTSHLLGLCYQHWARSSTSDSQRLGLHDKSLKLLQQAASTEEKDPEVMYSLGLVNALQRNMKAAFRNAKKFLDMVGGSQVSGWKLLALVASAEQDLAEAEAIVDLAIDETVKVDQLQFVRLKALLRVAQQQPKRAIETYRVLLSTIESHRKYQIRRAHSEVEESRNLEREVWLDLAAVYQKIGSWTDSSICLDKAKPIGYFCPRTWHATGSLLEAQSSYKEALVALSASLSIEPNYAPSIVSMAAILMKLEGTSSLPISKSLLMNAIQLEPTNHEAWLSLGNISKSEGSVKHAADCFQAAYDLKESSPVHNFL